MQGSEIGRFRGDHPVWLLIPLAKDQRQKLDCMQREITAKKNKEESCKMLTLFAPAYLSIASNRGVGRGAISYGWV